MTRNAALLVILVSLAACGVDGEPIKPTVEGSVGVSTRGNVYTNAGVGVRQGPYSVLFGL